LVSACYTPDLGRVGLVGRAVHVRRTPDQLEGWPYRIDGWIDYANSVVAK